jgi:hypothetical protein
MYFIKWVARTSPVLRDLQECFPIYVIYHVSLGGQDAAIHPRCRGSPKPPFFGVHPYPLPSGFNRSPNSKSSRGGDVTIGNNQNQRETP